MHPSGRVTSLQSALFLHLRELETPGWVAFVSCKIVTSDWGNNGITINSRCFRVPMGTRLLSHNQVASKNLAPSYHSFPITLPCPLM